MTKSIVTEPSETGFSSRRIYGIDLGTSYSSLALLDEEQQPRVIANSTGSPLTASVVVLTDGDKAHIDPPPGSLADAVSAVRILAIKREMGNPRFALRHGNHRLTPELISSLILRRLRQDAEKQLGPIQRVVITVPFYFNELRRRATRNAGQIAGLEVVDILNEPTAATLTYAWIKGELGSGSGTEPRKILVYDLGGGTFDVTVMEFTSTHFRVLATDGDTLLGGIEWTGRLVDIVADQVLSQGGTDPRETPQVRFNLCELCEQAKRELSQRLVTTVSFDHEGRRYDVDVTRRCFEQRSADLLQRSRDTTELVLKQVGVSGTDLDDMVLIGGSTAMPGVREMLKSISGRMPSDEIDAQLAVAQGAAIHAAILEAQQVGAEGRSGQVLVERLRSITTSNVNSHSLGIEVTDPEVPSQRWNHVMIPRNTPLPCQVVQRFVTTLENPRAVCIQLLEGEVAEIEACTRIGEFRVVDLPADLPAGSPVEIEYGYDQGGHIRVSARELVGDTEASLEIHWSDGVDVDALERFQELAREYSVE